MKTDYERTKEFMDSLGILYSNYTVYDTQNVVFGNTDLSDDVFPDCDKVGGYDGFYTRFEFDENGKFLTVGAWE